MDINKKNEIINDLVVFEREEKELISLYQSLLEFGVADSLPVAKRTEFRQSLEKLSEDSKRHLKVMTALITKYK